MVRRLTDLVAKQIGNATKKTCDKGEEKFDAVVAVETTTENLREVKMMKIRKVTISINV